MIAKIEIVIENENCDCGDIIKRGSNIS